MSDLGPLSLLRDAKRWLSERIDDGAHCPCCGQFAKVYKRQVNAQMAYGIIAMYRHDRYGFMHVPSVVPQRGGDLSKLAYWGLLEEATEPREDGGRAGGWRLTEAGREYVERGRSIEQYAHVYDGRLIELSGPMRNIVDALGKRFDYGELMGS